MIVEDDPKIAAILSEELVRFGYDVVSVDEPAQVKESFVALRPDLVLLDINLPRYDGFYLCRQLRTLSKIPIIFISARSDDLDQVRALENGGDDYITKPFDLELVVAKVHSAIRRSFGEYAVVPDSEVMTVAGLILSRNQCRVSYRNREIDLSPKEFRLLYNLAESHGEIVDRDQLLEALWDDVDFVDDNTLTVNVARLRRRMTELGLSDVIETKRGRGYRLNLHNRE